MNISIPEGLKGKSLYDFIVENKSALIAEKKFTMKRADPFTFSAWQVNEKGEVVKANTSVTEDLNEIKVRSVINTTNLMDSHSDVHLPGLWKKSLRDKKEFYLLQEHSMTFKGIISDEVKAYTQSMLWKDLGYKKLPGETEALIFDSIVKNARNDYMFSQYKAGYVKNHSVGMQYVDLELAINDEDYKEEFAVWNKYIGKIANMQDAEDQGFFWAVKEAKIVEGSAVPVGSNWATPTLDNNIKSVIQDDTEDDQPPLSTEQLEPLFDLDEAIRNTKFF